MIGLLSLALALLTVDAGPDQTIHFGFHLDAQHPGHIQLRGKVNTSDSGVKPDLQWVAVSGKGMILHPKRLDTILRVWEPGTYHLMLLAGDGKHLVNDSVIITVVP
jgi:hypothetical protein